MKNSDQKSTEKIAINPKNLKGKFLKSEGFKIGVAVLSFTILLAVVLPFFFDNSALKFQISQKVSRIAGANFTISGDVKISLFPTPSITAQDVYLQSYKAKSENSESEKIYNFYAKSVKIKFPVFKFSEGLLIKKITFTEALLESYPLATAAALSENKFAKVVAELAKNPQAEGSKIDSGISSKLFSIDEINPSKFSISSIQQIEIENGEVNFFDRFARKKEIKSINSSAKISHKKIAANGDFLTNDIASKFKFLAKFSSNSSSADSFFELSSPVIKMRAEGKISSENLGFLGSDFSGKIEAEILELKSFYKSYIDENGLITNKLKYSAQPIKITADIDSKSKEVAIKNLLVSSSLVSGKGEINLDFTKKIPLIDVDLDLDNFDFDNVWSAEAVTIAVAEIPQNKIQNPPAETSKVTAPTEKNTAEKNNPDSTVTQENATSILIDESPKEVAKEADSVDLNFTEKIKNFDLTAEIKVKNIKYLEGEVKDVDLYLTVSNHGEILVLPMTFLVPGEGLFRINGTLDNSTELPKFVGTFDATGKSLKEVFKWLKIESQNLKFDNLKEYNLYSNILLSPNSVALSNLYLNLNNGQSEFLGELRVDSGGSNNSIVSRFQASSFNIDDYFLTSGQNAYLSPGLLLKKLLWLNDISSSNDASFTFDKLIYKGEEFPEQSVKLRFGRGYLEITDLKLKSEKTSLKANLAMDISGQNPRFEMNITADNFHYETLRKSELALESVAAEAPKEAAEEGKEAAEEGKEKIAAATSKIKNYNFFDQFFSMPSLEGFDGNISFNLNNLEIDDLKVKNLKLGGRLVDGNINASELKCDLYGGSFSYKGLIGIKSSKTINGNLTFSNASLQPFLSDFFGIKSISGISNISASITSSANKKEEFVKQITSEIKFNANAPSVDGYGLSSLVQKMFQPQANRQELQSLEKILFNPQAKTAFKQANGTIQINGGKEGRLRINVTAPAVNGILSGTINSETATADLLFNAIFLTGTRQKQMPINIATNLKGGINDLSQSTNLDQAKQYLGLSKSVTTPAPTASTTPDSNSIPAESPAPISSNP